MLGNFQSRGVLPLWRIVGQGPSVLVVDAGGGCLDSFFPHYHISFSDGIGGSIQTEILPQRAVEPKTTNQIHRILAPPTGFVT